MRTQNVTNYQLFVRSLDCLQENYLIADSESWIKDATKSVDGLAASELRRLVSLPIRRNIGAFFTPSPLAQAVAKEMFFGVNKNSVFYDAACGAGNLLLASWNYLKDANISPSNSPFLLGTDIHEEFAAASKARLKIQALLFNPKKRSSTSIQLSFSITCKNGYSSNSFYKKATHVFVNPPFNLVDSTKEIAWSTGKVSAAALFIHRIIKNVNPNVRIIAILPEVLRSGSRYEKWRKMVLSNCIIEKVKLLGQFDEHADIDVFAISLQKRSVPVEIRADESDFQIVNKESKTISDLFSISVGTVVDNRDKHEGRSRGYIVSRGLEGWSLQKNFNRTRKHNGRAIKGPFVVIKRTSRMGSDRAIATIMNTPNPVYIDNHLIILIPKSGKLSDCKSVLISLRDNRTNEWINDKIRCRHLTVKVVRDIPIWPQKTI